MVGVATVTDGRVTGWRTDPGSPAARESDPPLGQVPTIHYLLASAVQAKAEAIGRVEFQFDPATGVPTNACVDWVKDGIDDEGGWKMSDFRQTGETPTP
jgi:Family of unknown function (DUF6174)